MSYKKFTKDDLIEELMMDKKQFGKAYLAVVNQFYPYLLGK